jgi:hypothetical protein
MINTASCTVDSYIYPEYKTATYDHDKDPATPEVNWPETYQRYASAVRRIDDGVGDLIKLLEDLGISDNTLIVFTSDNGPADEDYLPRPRYVQATPDFFNSFGPFDGIKRDTWEGGVREPTIVNWPARIPGRRVIDEPSAMYDWMSTLADAAGIAAPARTDGVSLLPLLTGERASVEHPIYVEYFEGRKTPDYPEFLRSHAGRRRNQMQMIRLGDLAGVRYDIQSAGDPFEIYNVVRDPQEAHNLAGDPAYQGMQASMQRYALQNRRPDSDAPRPYDSALIPAVEPQTLKPGLHWSAYGGSFPWVSDVSRLTPSAQGAAAQPDLSVMTSAGMLVYNGVIRVPADGEYEFSAQGDAPFIIRLHEALLVDASYGYAPGQRISARTMLKAGFHPVRISLLKRTGSEQGFQIQWHGPGKPMANVSAADFSHE